MTRTVLASGAVLLCLCGIPVRAAQSTTKVDRLCGYLVRETQRDRYSVPREKITLYRRENAVDCCDVQDRLAEVRTNRDGKFEFRHFHAGPYWVVAVVENREYKMAIDFAPSKGAQDCEWNLYTIESDGKFVLKTYLTVS